jgi:hypothetical protein
VNGGHCIYLVTGVAPTACQRTAASPSVRQQDGTGRVVDVREQPREAAEAEAGVNEM